MLQEYSGKFVLRLPAALHKKLRSESARKQQSLNQTCLHLLASALDKNIHEPTNPFHLILKNLQERFGENFLGLLMFGSQVTGDATPASDTDLLIVLDQSIPITRSLYQWWDQSIQPLSQDSLSPQFVHLPQSAEQAGSLWFEVALFHRLLWQKDHEVLPFLNRLKEFIVSGQITRHTQHGQPYWVRRNHEE